jgi:replicative DNA helicase
VLTIEDTFAGILRDALIFLNFITLIVPTLVQLVWYYCYANKVKRLFMSNNIIKTGFKDLDNIFDGGLKKGEVVFVASRSGIGKTTLALNILSNIAKYGSDCGYFTLDSTKTELVNKYNYTKDLCLAPYEIDFIKKAALSYCIDCGKASVSLIQFRFYPIFGYLDSCGLTDWLEEMGYISLRDSNDKANNYRKVLITKNEFEAIYGNDNKLNNDKEKHIIIFQNSRYSVELISTICKFFNANNKKIDVIAIDYIQLLNRDNDNIDTFYDSIKAIARELNICIIVLSQVGRTIHKQTAITDLKEFYPFAIKADSAIFLNRPDTIATKKAIATGLVKKGETTLTIYKNNNKPFGEVSLLFDSDNLRFYDFNN